MIPKKIHYCWFGGTPLPESVRKCIESWRRHCPDYEIIEWNESNIDISSVDYMREAYEERAWGFVPDVARLQIILNNGGIYLDTDVEVIKPLDSLLSDAAFVGIENNEPYIVNLGQGFGAEKGSPFLQELLNDYKDRHFRNADGSINKTASPVVQDGIMRRLGFNGRNETQQIRGAVIYSAEYFCPKSFVTGLVKITDATLSIHHYDGSWLSEKERKYLKCRERIFQSFGPKAGKIIWNVYRFIYKLSTVGIRNTLILIGNRLKKQG